MIVDHIDKESTIKFGFVLSYGTPAQILEMAKAAEDAGWDGVFSWDGISVGSMDSYDPWTVLAAIATVTERITLGALVFALARRKPWEVARQSITVDHLSNGRLVIPVGLGAATDDAGFARVNTDTSDRRVNAAKLDECLAFLELAWAGKEFSAAGEHYSADKIIFRPTPVQHPRIPVWCVGLWPVPKSIDRAARWMALSPLSGDANSPPTTFGTSARGHRTTGSRSSSRAPPRVRRTGGDPGGSRRPVPLGSSKAGGTPGRHRTCFWSASDRVRRVADLDAGGRAASAPQLG
jgi:alkanesulfonate monooxygenase SsuD/methylene tetrahydromethanopterin reductase-like flavin-dependent oxidoreductase (luciferase family)